MGTTGSGILFALGSFAIYASQDVIVKLLGGSYAPFQIVFFSVLFSFPLATVLLMRDAQKSNLRPVHPWWMALRTGAAVGAGAFAFYAFSVLPLADTYAILFASPLLITLLAIPILGERVRLRRGLAVAVGPVGVGIVVQPGQTALSLGHAAALASACCSATSSVVVRKIGREERSVVLLLYPMMANFLIMGAILPFVYKPMPIEALGGMAAIAFCSFIAMLGIIAAYTRAEAALIAPMQYSQMLWALFYGWLIFGEWPSATTLVGAGVIIASGLYIVFRESRGGTSKTTPVLRTRTRPGTPAALRIGPFLRREKSTEMLS